jgi:hypothetical protein
MKYHDNEVKFSFITKNFNKACRILGGSYIIEQRAITSGQDPDDKNTPGLRKTLNSKGEILFRAGRKKSVSVANWFNKLVPVSKTTFNHSAEELNFAFIGTLQLTITGGILGDKANTYQFSKIALAQGHVNPVNNWWFGGEHCNNVGSNMVVCRGINIMDNSTMEATFVRGGNSSNEVQIKDLSLIDAGNWMKDVQSTTKLSQIVMPGSHDAGMYTTSHCAPPLVASKLSKTQGESVHRQLALGSRYFDIRVDYDHGKLVTYHRNKQWGCNGGDLQTVLDDARSFLKSHPSEAAILKFSHIRNDSGKSAGDTKERINNLINEYSNFTYKNSSPNVNLADIELGDVRGKMILIFDYSDFISPANGRFRYYDGRASKGNITVFDEYSNTDNYNVMQNDQREKWHKHGGLGQTYFFLLSWTLTPQGITKSVKSLADTANYNLAAALSLFNNEFGTKPNIVYVDFLDSNICQTIIKCNFS